MNAAEEEALEAAAAIPVPWTVGTHTGVDAPEPYLGVGHPDQRRSAATARQIDYLQALMKDRDSGIDPSDVDVIVAAWIEGGILTKGFVSEKIDEYKALPNRARKLAEPGYYMHNGIMYCVVENKAKTGTYAKALIVNGSGRWSWEYEKGKVLFLADLVPLTIEEAAAFGKLHGQCAVCLRPLVDPKSVEAGIGPHCAKKLAHK